MGSTGSRRSGGLVLAAMLIAGCGQPGASTPAAATATAAAVASAAPSAPASAVPTVEPTVAPTEEPVVTPVPIDPSCPQEEVDSIISVQEYVDAKTSCFKNGIRVRGWLDTPPALGFLPPVVKPSWIYYPDDSAASLWHQPPPDPDHVCAESECWWFFPHMDPDVGLDFEPLQRWVILTGHTRDARAENCHYEGEGPNPNPELVLICGRQLVVTAIEAAH
jgi:hypothetical protein